MLNNIAAWLRRIADSLDGRGKGLPQNLQTHAAAYAFQLRAWSCAVTVRIAHITGDREASFNTASGVLLEFPKRVVIATADHVIEEYVKARGAGEPVAFVIDNMPLTEPRVVYRNHRDDIALIEVPSSGRRGIKAVPYRPAGLWPPPSVQVGDTVLVCGFPKRYRYDGDEILHGDLNLLVSVSSVGVSYFVLNIDWKHLDHDGRIKPPSHQVNYGGVSGGPVFLYDGGANPLVGIVSQAPDRLPLWRIASLASLPPDVDSVSSEAV
jgi:S1-C subfamily serine protease